jgi:hypothetical protein
MKKTAPKLKKLKMPGMKKLGIPKLDKGNKSKY